MKTFVTLLLIVGFIPHTKAMENTTSTLEKATVFLQGAELHHTAKASLQKGSNDIRIGGISPAVDISSFKVKTSSGVIVSSFEFTVDHLTAITLNEVARKLESEIKTNEKLAEQVKTDKKITGNLLRLLQTSVEKSASGSESGLSIDALVKTMEYYKTKAEELEKKLSEYSEKESKIEEKIALLKAQYAQEAIKNAKKTGILSLHLSSPITGECHFSISYYTPSAHWKPFYDINVESIDKPIQIASKAKVHQTTGLDWEKVKISLSTSRPSNGKVAPIFSAWFLREKNAPAPRNMVMSRSVAQNSISYEVAEMSADMVYDEKVMEDYVLVSESQMNITYDIDMVYTIPGNGKEQNIDLKKYYVDATFKYYCAPKLDYATYLIADIANWNTLSLLSGPANITYDGTYVGETHINAESTGEVLSLTLGSDTRVPVKRVKMKEFSGSSLFSNEIKEESGYQLTVKNNRNVPIKMILKEQYPISTFKDVTVELSKETTPPTFNNTEVGVITWEHELKPGESRSYQIIYSIRRPKNKEVR